MNQSLTLPMADKFYHDKQTSAFIRSVNVSWEKPEKDHYYLEYSYNQKDWYALNGGFPIVLPCDELSVTDALETQDLMGKQSLLQPLVLYRINMESRNQYVFSL